MELKQRIEHKLLDSFYKQAPGKSVRRWKNSAIVKRIDSALRHLYLDASSAGIVEINGIKKLSFTQSGQQRVLSNADVARVETDQAYRQRRASDIIDMITNGMKQNFPEMIFFLKLSKEEHELYSKALQATNNKDLKGALQYLEKAVTGNTPYYPSLNMYNLGIAESAIPGRELRAIAWLSGFMTSELVSNTDLLKNQIESLRLRNRSTIINMITKVQDISSRFSGYQKNTFLGQVALLWAQIGEPLAVQKAVDLMSLGDGNFTNTVINAYIKSGDLITAEDISGRIRNEFTLRKALVDLAKAYIENGDISEGQRKISEAVGKDEAMENDWQVCSLLLEISAVLREICIKYSQSGEADLLKANLATATRIVNRIGPRRLYYEALINLGETQYMTGQKAAGMITFDLIWNESNSIQPVNDKIFVLTELISRRQKVGYLDKFHELLDNLTALSSFANNELRDHALASVAEFKLNIRDIEGAKKTYYRIKNSLEGSKTLYKLIVAYLQENELQKANALIDSIKFNDWKDKARTVIREFGRKPGVKLNDWVIALNDNAFWSECPLAMNIFKDLEIHTRSIDLSPGEHSYGILELFEKMKTIVMHFISAEKRINLMLANLYEFKNKHVRYE